MGNTPGLSRGFKSSGFRTAVSVMGTLLESREALRSRGLEVSLTTDEVNALINNRVDSLARLAFAACPPGDAPTNEQIDSLFNGQLAPKSRNICINETLDL